MDSILRGFLGLFFLMLVTFSGIGLMEACIDARNADAFLTLAVDEIESAYCSASVINDCEKDAKSNGYELSVDVSKNPQGESFGTASLDYVYQVPLLGIKQKHRLFSDIR